MPAFAACLPKSFPLPGEAFLVGVYFWACEMREAGGVAALEPVC